MEAAPDLLGLEVEGVAEDEHGPLDGEHRVAAPSLDLEVGGRDGLAAGSGGGIPPARRGLLVGVAKITINTK